MTGGPPRNVRRYVLALAALAGALVAGAAWLQLREGFPAGPLWTGVGALVFVAAFFLLGQTSFTFAWRGHRHRMVLDEVALYVGLLALPAPAVPLLVGVSGVLEQARFRREGLKATFNLAQAIVAVSAAVALDALLVQRGVAPTLAAIPATLAYPLVSNFLTSGVLSRLSGEAQSRIFVARFLAPGLLAGSVGAGGGVAVAALWSLHPLTLVALMPFVFLTYRYGVLASAADRELEVHKKLTEVTQGLVGISDINVATRRILVACGDAFPSVGRAELLVEGEPPIAEDFGQGADARAAPLDEPVPGVGTLRLRPRHAANKITQTEEAVARIVAQQLAATLGQARALSRMETIARQEKLSALGTLVAGVAHEINNPVTYMRGALELANMDLDDVEKAEAEDEAKAVAHARLSLQRLAEGVDRVQKITHALKAVARQGTGERASEDLRKVAEDVVQVVRIGLPRGVTLDAKLDAPVARVKANAAEMHQVVLNLVKNAGEALAQSGGHIAVRAWDEQGQVFVTVEDDGPGIAADVQKRLFEPFFTTKREGTGLGLSLSRGIVEAHGGELRLDSAPGRGTRFTIRLPAA